MTSLKKILAILMAFCLLFSFCACEAKDGAQDEIQDNEEIVAKDSWIASWGLAMQGGGIDQMPTSLSLKGNTLRQQIQVSLGGEKIRLTFSNQYGSIPVQLESVHLAKLLNYGSSEIDTATDTVVTFEGSESIEIPIGATVTSDEIAFPTEALDLLAVTTKFGNFIGSTLTCHCEGNRSSWLAEGNAVSDASIETKNDKACVYFLARADVLRADDSGAVICLGDSITDGVGSDFDSLGSWPDRLSQLLQADSATKDLAVINMGISGNKIFYGAGDPCKDRITRDVLDIPGAKYCIIMIGINDIIWSDEDISASLIDEIAIMVEKCHEKGIKVYAATLTPIGSSWHYSEVHENMRVAINDFMFSAKSKFDGVIDMSSAIADEGTPVKMKAEYNWGDYLHPGQMGYEVMGKAAFDVIKEVHTK